MKAYWQNITSDENVTAGKQNSAKTTLNLDQVTNLSADDMTISIASQAALDLKANTSITINAKALTSDVVLDADDLSDASTSNKFATAAQLDKIDDITFGTHATDWSGIWASDQIGDIDYQIVKDKVTLFLPEVISTATIGSSIYAVTSLPASLQPMNEERVSIIIEDSFTSNLGMAVISITGDIRIYTDLSYSNFMGTSSSGFYKSTLSYNLK
tara:strand:+ start:6656 stop:7297 length:642 start_codon:yes stop_codon:yes gene_type:complete